MPRKRKLLVEVFLDVDRASVLVDDVTVRELRGRRRPLLHELPIGATKAVTSALNWLELSLNECEQVPYSCAKTSTGKPLRTRCPACRIRETLRMPPLKNGRDARG